MIDKNTKLEEEIKRLKEKMKPDDEVEKLATLMAGKSRGYLRTVGGTFQKNSFKKICEICWLVCEKEIKYHNHKKSHSAEGDWCCHKCDFQTKTGSNLDTHISTFVHEVYDERKKYNQAFRAKHTTKKTEIPINKNSED